MSEQMDGSIDPHLTSMPTEKPKSRTQIERETLWVAMDAIYQLMSTQHPLGKDAGTCSSLCPGLSRAYEIVSALVTL